MRDSSVIGYGGECRGLGFMVCSGIVPWAATSASTSGRTPLEDGAWSARPGTGPTTLNRRLRDKGGDPPRAPCRSAPWIERLARGRGRSASPGLDLIRSEVDSDRRQQPRPMMLEGIRAGRDVGRGRFVGRRLPAPGAGLRRRGLAHEPRAPGRRRARVLWAARAGRRGRGGADRGIPFEIVDLSGEFAATVIDDFVAEHEAGRTPNPCARCNGEIKFGAFLRRADELGIDLVATGHYVRTERTRDGGWQLLRGADAGEGSVLHAPHAGSARSSRAPCSLSAGCRRPTRGALAERFGLPVASKPDSQELCFAPSGDAGAFVRSAAPQLVREGEVVDAEGRAIGDARRDVRFTVGQRRGLGVATGERRYVVGGGREAEPRRGGPQELLSRRGLVADRVSWVGGRAPDDGPFEASVRIRYRGDDVAAVIEPLDGDRIGWSSAAAARGRARPERGDVPRRRAARRRAHRRSGSADARSPRRRSLRLSSELPGRCEEVEAALKLLRRKTKSFDIQVEDLTLHITASDDFAEESRAQALSFWEQIQSYALRNPEFRRSKRPLRRVPEDAPAIVREMVAASSVAGVGPMFTFRGAVTDQVGRFLAGSLSEVTVSCDGDYFIQTKKRMRLAVRRHGGEPIAVAVEPVKGGVGVSTTLGRGRDGGGPDGLAVLANVVHAGRRGRRRGAGAPAQGGRVRAGAPIPPAGARGARRGGGRGRARSASPAAWRSRGREPVRGTRAAPRPSSASRSSASSSTTTATAITSSTIPRSPTSSTTRWSASSRRSRTASPSSSRPTLRRSAWATCRPTCSRRSHTGRPCSRSTTRSRSRSWRRGTLASRSGSATPRGSRAS